MHSSMTLASIVSLFASMVVLATIPSVSVLVVSTRSAAGGFLHGVFVTLGIILGDIIYILVALFGLALLTGALGEAAFLIKYAGGAYMIWMGIRLWRASGGLASDTPERSASSLFSSFATGLVITLADQKVVLFYLGFLPAFVDIAGIGALDAAIIAACTVIAVGGVKLIYALVAQRAGLMFGSGASRLMNRSAAGIMASIGCYLIARP